MPIILLRNNARKIQLAQFIPPTLASLPAKWHSCGSDNPSPRSVATQSHQRQAGHLPSS